VVRQPRDAEDDDDKRDDAARLGRALSGALLVDCRRTLSAQEAHDEHVDDGDEHQRHHVAERREQQKDRRDPAVLDSAVGDVGKGLGCVYHHRWNVERADAEPQTRDEQSHFANVCTVAEITAAVNMHYQYVSVDSDTQRYVAFLQRKLSHLPSNIRTSLGLHLVLTYYNDYHGLRQPVLTATGLVDGQWQTLPPPPHRIDTRKPIAKICHS